MMRQKRSTQVKGHIWRGQFLFGTSGSWNTGSGDRKPGIAQDESGDRYRTCCDNDVHYIMADDAKAHDILLCIQTQKRLPMRTG